MMIKKLCKYFQANPSIKDECIQYLINYEIGLMFTVWTMDQVYNYYARHLFITFYKKDCDNNVDIQVVVQNLKKIVQEKLASRKR